MTLPYENATTGDKAMAEIQKILQKFGCQSFGHYQDFENKKLVVQFKYRNVPVSVEASLSGYAAAWLREHPWSNRMKATEMEHERKALDQASLSVYSILRDWIKGQTMAVECGILSFEGAFLGQIMLPTGNTVLQEVSQQNILMIGEG